MEEHAKSVHCMLTLYMSANTVREANDTAMSVPHGTDAVQCSLKAHAVIFAERVGILVRATCNNPNNIERGYAAVYTLPYVDLLIHTDT